MASNTPVPPQVRRSQLAAAASFQLRGAKKDEDEDEDEMEAEDGRLPRFYLTNRHSAVRTSSSLDEDEDGEDGSGNFDTDDDAHNTSTTSSNTHLNLSMASHSPATPLSRRSFSSSVVSSASASHQQQLGPRRSSLEQLVVESNPSPLVQHALLDKPGLKRWDSGDFYAASPASHRKLLATQDQAELWSTSSSSPPQLDHHHRRRRSSLCGDNSL